MSEKKHPDSCRASTLINSPFFLPIAQALGTDQEQTVAFIKKVHRIARRGKLKDILACITEHNARTANEVATKILELHAQQSRSRPKARRRQRFSRQRYVWNPDTGSIEAWNPPTRSDE